MCVYYTLFPSFSFNNKRPRNLLSETRKQAEAEAAAIAAAPVESNKNNNNNTITSNSGSSSSSSSTKLWDISYFQNFSYPYLQ